VEQRDGAAIAEAGGMSSDVAKVSSG